MFYDPLLIGLRKYGFKWAVSIKKKERWGEKAFMLIARELSVATAHRVAGELRPMSVLPCNNTFSIFH